MVFKLFSIIEWLISSTLDKNKHCNNVVRRENLV